MIASSYKAMGSVLPKHITAERMARVALAAATKRPKLLDCDPNTFIAAMLECATLGLEPEVAGQCWILPYGQKATFIAGYRGLLQLAWRSGQLSTMGAEVVYEKDSFKYRKYPPDLQHEPSRDEDRGEKVAAYAYATLKNGGEMWVVMEAHEIEAIRKRSPAAKQNDSPWNHADDSAWMWKKTALRQLLKFLPMSVEVQRVVDNDERADIGLPQNFDLPTLDPAKEVPQAGTDPNAVKNAATATTPPAGTPPVNTAAANPLPAAGNGTPKANAFE